MGYVFEELIRKFNEENNEEAGEHFTPREIIRLMTRILFEPVKEKLREKVRARFTIYDPACGSGGMMTEAEKYAKLITNMQEKNFSGKILSVPPMNSPLKKMTIFLITVISSFGRRLK